MDVRRSRLPENPVNLGLSAQKSAKQGDGPSARGTQSTKQDNQFNITKQASPTKVAISFCELEKQFRQLITRIFSPHKGLTHQKRIHITRAHGINIITAKDAAFSHQ